MFIFGMIAMYFLLNLVVVVVLLIQEMEMIKEKRIYLKVVRKTLIFLLIGTILVFMETLQQK